MSRSFTSARAAVRVAIGILICASCTRMPTAPTAEITVSGVITGPDGSPMRAVLSFRPVPSKPDPGSTARADSSGVYSARLATGTYDVVIAPNASGLLYHVQRVKFTRSSTRFDHRFSGHELTGTVRGPDGAVIDSGQVWIRILTPTMYSIGSSELSHGVYSFLVSTGTYSLHVETADYWSGLEGTSSEPVAVSSNTTFDLDMGGVPVTGTVLGPNGTPMERVAVDAYRDGAQAHHRTGSDGRYRLWLHTGEYRFRVWPLDSVHIAGRLPAPVQVQGPSMFDFDLAGMEWSGVVRWRGSGAPVPDVWVTAAVGSDGTRWAVSRTDFDGRFRLVVDPGETYYLHAYSGLIRDVFLYNLTARTDTSFALLADPGSGSLGDERPVTPTPPGARGIPSPGSSGP